MSDIGPKSGEALCRLTEIVDGASRVFIWRDEDDRRFEMFVHRTGPRVVAYENRCPHAGHPLDWTPGRFLDPSATLFQCASHRARFRIEDGVCVSGPCPGKALTPVPVTVVDGIIRVS